MVRIEPGALAAEDLADALNLMRMYDMKFVVMNDVTRKLILREFVELLGQTWTVSVAMNLGREGSLAVFQGLPSDDDNVIVYRGDSDELLSWTPEEIVKRAVRNLLSDD